MVNVDGSARHVDSRTLSLVKSVGWGTRVLMDCLDVDRSVGPQDQMQNLAVRMRSVKMGSASSPTIQHAVTGNVPIIQIVQAVSVKKDAALTLNRVMRWDGVVKVDAV